MTQHVTTETAPTETAPTEPVTTGPASQATPSRRRVLATSGVVVAAAAVTAACGSSSSSAGTGTTGGTAPAEPSTAAKADVPVGGGVILTGRKVVITQPTAGTYKAFTAVCTHQGCVVSSVSNGTINCACHGSAFSAADGSVQNGPATSPLAPVNVTVAGDQITVA